jgi:hypothetical protein
MYPSGYNLLTVTCRNCGAANDILARDPPMRYTEQGKRYFVVDYTFSCGVCRHPHPAGSRVSARDEKTT